MTLFNSKKSLSCYALKHINKSLSIILPMVITLDLTGCAFAPWESSKLTGKQPEEQVDQAKIAVAKNPEATSPRKDLLVSQELAVTKLVTDAEAARQANKLEEANTLYDRVLKLLPDNSSAINGKASVERELANNKMIAEADELLAKNNVEGAKSLAHQVLIQNPQHAGALSLQQKVSDKGTPIKSEPPRLKPTSDKFISLELRDANIKVVFEALSRATGINFILDKDIKPDTKATVFIKKVRIEDAIDTVLATNGLQKKVLSDNSALIFPNSQQKLKEYQDLVIRSFYLNNTTAKQVAALLKTMVKTKDIFVDERLNMIVMRDTPEVIRIAEKLVAANDLEDPEVMLEIEVLEVSRSRLQELGVEYPSRIAVNNLTNIATTTTTAIASTATSVLTEQPLTLKSLQNLSSGSLNVSPNPALNFRKTLGDVNLLSNPRIRVRNNEKAKILIGDKVPIITSTAAVNAGVAESVQYIDVGLKLDVEPRITADDHVNIKVALEVSSLGERTVTRGGTVAYTIGTRNASTLLRLKNNETQVLAGLISDDERKNSSRLPGLGDIPLLGRLFANQVDSKNKTEIVLAITPRIISNIVRPQADITEYWSGTDSMVTDKPQITIQSAAPIDPRDAIRARMQNIQSNNVPENESQSTEKTPAQEDVVNQPETIPEGTNPAANPNNAEQLTPIAVPEMPSVNSKP